MTNTPPEEMARDLKHVNDMLDNAEKEVDTLRLLLDRAVCLSLEASAQAVWVSNGWYRWSTKLAALQKAIAHA